MLKNSITAAALSGRIPGEIFEEMIRPVYVGVFVIDKKIIQGTHPGRMRLGMLNPAISQTEVTIYYFSLKDIDYQNEIIAGVFYGRERECWIEKTFPLPDILYMRGVPDLRDKDLLQFLDFIAMKKIRMVNTLLTFDKWDVHRALNSNCEIQPHLPETRLFRSHTDDLTPMLRRYGRVYLKACRGRQGRQVMQLTRLPGGFYEVNYHIDRPVARKISGRSLPRIMHSIFNGQDFIIQQPLDLIQFAGGKVDLRAEVQRNGRGQLEVVAIPVRVGRESSPITTHALSYRFEEFFTDLFGGSQTAVESLKKRLHRLLYRIYESIEKNFGPFGELGIDIGLDKNDRLWFIECNSQSAKVSLTGAYRGNTVIKAFTNPLEYANYIAGSMRCERDSSQPNHLS
jgi:hypothetical protein